MALFPGQPTPRLYDRVVEVLRSGHYSRRTELTHIQWIRRFIRYQGRLQDGYDIRTVQGLLGYKEIKPAMVYTHVLNHAPSGVRGPFHGL